MPQILCDPAPKSFPLARAALASFTAFAFFAALNGCTDSQTTGWTGYAEGDYVYVASALAGRLEEVAVSAGQQIAKDAPLFRLESENENAARAEAERRLASAQAQASNLDSGKRAAEVAVIRAQLAQAQASARLAEDDLARQKKLIEQGFVATSRVEDASTALKLAQARVAEAQAALDVALLPARTDERTASRANADAAREVLHQNQWRKDQKQQAAPVAAEVSEVFFQPGEFVAAGQPVVALLPAANVKAKFFVAENELAQIQLGQPVLIRCDACTGPIKAHISRIATAPEYTPPVIYSNAQRSKLVYLVEAVPDAPPKPPLKPGQPLDVTRATTTVP